VQPVELQVGVVVVVVVAGAVVVVVGAGHNAFGHEK